MMTGVRLELIRNPKITEPVGISEVNFWGCVPQNWQHCTYLSATRRFRVLFIRTSSVIIGRSSITKDNTFACVVYSRHDKLLRNLTNLSD